MKELAAVNIRGKLWQLIANDNKTDIGVSKTPLLRFWVTYVRFLTRLSHSKPISSTKTKTSKFFESYCIVVL